MNNFGAMEASTLHGDVGEIFSLLDLKEEIFSLLDLKEMKTEFDKNLGENIFEYYLKKYNFPNFLVEALSAQTNIFSCPDNTFTFDHNNLSKITEDDFREMELPEVAFVFNFLNANQLLKLICYNDHFFVWGEKLKYKIMKQFLSKNLKSDMVTGRNLKSLNNIAFYFVYYPATKKPNSNVHIDTKELYFERITSQYYNSFIKLSRFPLFKNLNKEILGIMRSIYSYKNTPESELENIDLTNIIVAVNGVFKNINTALEFGSMTFSVDIDEKLKQNIGYFNELLDTLLNTDFKSENLVFTFLKFFVKKNDLFNQTIEVKEEAPIENADVVTEQDATGKDLVEETSTKEDNQSEYTDTIKDRSKSEVTAESIKNPDPIEPIVETDSIEET